MTRYYAQHTDIDTRIYSRATISGSGWQVFDRLSTPEIGRESSIGLFWSRSAAFRVRDLLNADYERLIKKSQAEHAAKYGAKLSGTQ